MARTVLLTDPALEALRSEKRENESDSDVVLRLVRAVRGLRPSRRDPEHFLRTRASLERWWSIDEHRSHLERMRGADRDRT